MRRGWRMNMLRGRGVREGVGLRAGDGGKGWGKMR